VPVADAVSLTALRLILFQNGYPIIKAYDKSPRWSGWNVAVLDARAINEWINPRATVSLYSGTGMLVADGLAAIDLDIPNRELARDMRAKMHAIAPQVFAERGALERGRSDASPKCMFFMRRAGEPFTVRSRKWSFSPEDHNAPTCMVEIFASDRNGDGAASRQVGAFGPHTIDDQGVVTISYAWKGPSPKEVPLSDLPELTLDQAKAVAEAFDRLAEAAGMRPVPGHKGGLIIPTDVYDLDDTMRFEGEDFAGVTLAELTDIYRVNSGMGNDTRCSSSFTGEGGTRKDRCHVGWSGSPTTGHITVHDYGTAITHRPKGLDRPENFGAAPEGLEAAAEALERLAEPEPEPEPPAAAERTQTALRTAIEGNLTEHAIANAIAWLYQDELCFAPAERTWLRFVGPCWERSYEASVRVAVARFCSRITFPSTPEGNAMRHKVQSTRHAGAVEMQLRSLLEYTGGFDLDPFLVAAGNLAIELDTGLARPGEPADRLRKRLGYEPSEDEDCPLWRQFLRDVTCDDPDLERFLKQWAGLGLCGDPTHQKLAFFYGTGRNGKNTFTDTLVKIVGEFGHQANLDAFMMSRGDKHPTDMWALKGKRTVIASEVDPNAVWDTARIKALTGDELITARGMRQDFETFKRSWTISIIGNNQPRLRDVDEAIRRRIRMVPFDMVLAPADVDVDLPSKLLGEAPGILRWMMNGLLDARQAGLVEPARVSAETADYFEAEDTIGNFIEQEVERDPRRKARDPWSVTTAELYRRWCEFADVNGFHPGTAATMAKKLRKTLGIKPRHTNKGNVWDGIRLTARQLFHGFDGVNGVKGE
jgi:putative DNA primase/helicase